MTKLLNGGLARSALVVAALVMTSCSAFLLMSMGKVYAANCGNVQVAGSSWAGGNGVDVHSNGADDGTIKSCGGYITKLSASPPQWGWGWQCVELVQRMYKTHGWSYPQIDYAYEFYTRASNAGLTTMANGSVVLANIVPGDMLVTHEGQAGHVMLVDYVSGSSIYAVDQNGKDGGRTTVTFSNGSLSDGSYYQFSGVVHSPSNTLTNGSTSNNTVLAVKKLTQSDGTNEVFWAKNTDVFESWWRGNSGINLANLIHISQGDIVGIDVALYSNSEHDLFTATAHNVWETWWYSGQGTHTAEILSNIGNIHKIQKTIGPDGVTNQLYVLTDSGVSEYWWNSGTNGPQGGSLYPLANPVDMYKTLEPDGTQVVYVADQNYAYMVRWGGGLNGIQVTTVINVSGITALSFSENSDGKHRLYVGASSGGIWEANWYRGGSFGYWYMTGGAPVVALQKWEDDSEQVLYEATAGGVFEYYWPTTSNTLGSDTIVGSLGNVHAFARSTDPNGVQSVYTATGTNILESWWIPGGNGVHTGQIE